MARLARRLAVGLLVAYLAVLAVLFFAQRSLIYPAPQERHAPAPGFAEVTLQTADGLALQAHWRAPDAGRPAIVFFHGNGGSLAGARFETQAYAEQGYGVLLVEYRGYGGNPGAPSEAGFYQDGRAAMAFLGAQGLAAEQTVIVGHSLGTGTATQMAREFAPAALVLLAPLTSLPDAAGEAMPLVPAGLLVRDRFENIAKVPRLRMPILILHGTADTVVPFALGERLAKAAPTATFRAVEGAEHMISHDAGVQAAQVAWLNGLGL
ncbi:alpha/beta fold hydrolase [Porphyrobacter sp. YT40]|uniref:alpha/beta hydrolase n=1 Tax=Porphyrobacter sp. YT40 TaxID=2547601 RepID=UPI001141472C|nr:alpha/beta fold hydrolase [Porphyrobacter sp. YT40]QDH33360.1 alpha/beta fold hydrolase [Porphyrobacter sp. YT40]